MPTKKEIDEFVELNSYRSFGYDDKVSKRLGDQYQDKVKKCQDLKITASDLLKIDTEVEALKKKLAEKLAEKNNKSDEYIKLLNKTIREEFKLAEDYRRLADRLARAEARAEGLDKVFTFKCNRLYMAVRDKHREKLRYAVRKKRAQRRRATEKVRRASGSNGEIKEEL
jgi:septal ring factor EnvC (AmiA/AmiB activator)